MKLNTLMRRDPTEAAARRWFEKARWPDGPVCPLCGVEERASALRTRRGQYTCLDWRYRYSVTSRTALHNTKLPLRTWLIAMYMITTSSKGISAMKLADWLGVSYKMAWHVGHRIRAMMAAERILLEGVVETAFRCNERAGDVLGNLSKLVRSSNLPLAYGTLTA